MMPHKCPKVATAYRKEWKRKRRAADPNYARTQNQKWRDVNPKGYMLARVRVRAREQGVPFDLTVDDFEIPTHCPVFGMELAFSTGRSTRPDNIPSMDRIVPEKGYVKGNVQVISMRANRIKSDATVEDLEAILRYLRVHY